MEPVFTEPKQLSSPSFLPLTFQPDGAMCGEITTKEDSQPVSDRDESWEFVTVAQAGGTDADTFQCPHEQLEPDSNTVGNHDDVFSEADASLRLLFETHKPGETEKAIYGVKTATSRALHRWLRRAADTISSGNQPKISQAYRDYAQAEGLHDKLAREILIHRIERSPAQVQHSLAQHLVLLVLILVEHHDSDDAQICIESNEAELLESLVSSLRSSEPPKRPTLEEAQITGLIQALLELSGGEVDLRQHVFAKGYTAEENANLYASILGITRTRQFGDFNPEDLCNSISNSPVFSEMAISIRNLESWTTKMRGVLPLGFPEGYLNLPSLVLNEFGFVHMGAFNCYLAYTYEVIPSLQKPDNSMPMLLAYSSNLATRGNYGSDCQLDILHKWVCSEDGWSLHKNLVRGAQDSQSVEQLSLIIIALMSHSRLIPDHQDHLEQPIQSSYLADLDAHFQGDLLGNSGRVAEQMVFALIRVLSTFGDRYEDIVKFLVTALDRDPPLLHPLDGLSDRYLRCRIDCQTHGAAFDTAMKELSRLGTAILI